MPRKLSEIKEFTSKKSLENIHEDPEKNSVLGNIRKLYDALGEFTEAADKDVEWARDSMRNILDAHAGAVEEKIGDNSIKQLAPMLEMVYKQRAKDDGVLKIKDEQKRKELRNLIEYVAAGLDLAYTVDGKPNFEISNEQKKNVANMESVGKRMKEVEGKSALNLLDANKDKVSGMPRSFRGQDARQKETEARRQLEDICIDIMATRRSIGANRNDKSGLSKASVDAEKRHAIRQELEKNGTLKQFLSSMSYSELRKLAANGHGGAMEDSFIDYIKNCEVIPKDAPQQYMPTARERVEALQKKMDTTSFQMRTDAGSQRAVYIELLAARAAVNSVRGDKTSLNFRLDPEVLAREREKMKADPLFTALVKATWMGNRQAFAAEVAVSGHGGRLEDILRKELRSMAIQKDQGYKLQNVDPRFAPTVGERMGDLELELGSVRMPAKDKLRAAFEYEMLTRKSKDEKLADVSEMNLQTEEKAAIYSNVLDAQAAHEFVSDAMTRGFYSASQKIEQKYGGRLQAERINAEINKELAGKPSREEVQRLAARMMVLQQAKAQFRTEQDDAKLFRAVSKEMLESNAAELMSSAAFQQMCDALGPEKLAAQAKGRGNELVVSFGKAKAGQLAPAQPGEQAPVKNEQLNKEEQKEEPQAGQIIG